MKFFFHTKDAVFYTEKYLKIGKKIDKKPFRFFLEFKFNITEIEKARFLISMPGDKCRRSKMAFHVQRLHVFMSNKSIRLEFE